MNLRKIDNDLEGHPTPRLSFIDVATGSLGQGLSIAAGMAYTAKNFDKARLVVRVNTCQLFLPEFHLLLSELLNRFQIPEETLVNVIHHSFIGCRTSPHDKPQVPPR